MIKDKVMVIQEGLANDLKAEKFKSEVTMEVLREVAIRIYTLLDFTLDVSNEEGRPVACLDTQIWWGKAGHEKDWFNHEKQRELAPRNL